MKDTMLERYAHGAATLSVHSECVEVISFGGKKHLFGSKLVDTVVLRFGRSHKNTVICIFRIYLICSCVLSYPCGM